MAKRKPEPEPKLARDFSQRGLGAADARLRALAERLGVELYDGRRAAAEQGLAQPEPGARLGRGLL